MHNHMRAIKAVFLDRDGVINKYPGDFKYVTSWRKFHFLKGVKKALKKLGRAGFEIAVISNQAGVSKGAYSQKTLDLITKNMLSELKKYKISISGVYYCTHRQEENCPCRKPKTGLVKKAISNFKQKGKTLKLRKSFFIGDTERDVSTGKGIGLKTILLFSGKEKLKNQNDWKIKPDFIANDLSQAADLIIKIK